MYVQCMNPGACTDLIHYYSGSTFDASITYDHALAADPITNVLSLTI